jgi:magnesium-transporting ATPase (P-type)
MLKFISYKCGVNFEKIRQTYVPREPIRFLFDSARKRMSSVIEALPGEKTEHGYSKRIHVKGASEIVLATCNYFLDS